MATTPQPSVGRKVDYPTSDGKPMAETDVHRDLMVDLIQTLDAHFAADPLVYVSGNLMMFYEEGNKRKHISPDVFLVRGIAKGLRDYYLTWVEGKSPDIAIELTSKSTQSEDVKKKMALYRDVLKIPEYFLFDPFRDYLKPPMQGYRLVDGQYEPIAMVDGRLPSLVLGLHLKRDGSQLRLVQVNGESRRLPTPREAIAAARLLAEVERQRADTECQRADARSQRADALSRSVALEGERADLERERADLFAADNARLLLELEEFRRRGAGGG